MRDLPAAGKESDIKYGDSYFVVGAYAATDYRCLRPVIGLAGIGARGRADGGRVLGVGCRTGQYAGKDKTECQDLEPTTFSLSGPLNWRNACESARHAR